MFAYGIDCSVSNAYVLDKFAKPIEHAHSGVAFIGRAHSLEWDFA